jgi:hypothetical protein
MDTSFRMDRWMLRFLQEFTSPMYDREQEGMKIDVDMWSVENVGHGNDLGTF